jgi:hypothetical protein
MNWPVGFENCGIEAASIGPFDAMGDQHPLWLKVRQSARFSLLAAVRMAGTLILAIIELLCISFLRSQRAKTKHKKSTAANDHIWGHRASPVC